MRDARNVEELPVWALPILLQHCWCDLRIIYRAAPVNLRRCVSEATEVERCCFGVESELKYGELILYQFLQLYKHLVQHSVLRARLTLLLRIS